MIRGRVIRRLAPSLAGLAEPLDLDGARARRSDRTRGDHVIDPGMRLKETLKPAAVLVPLVNHDAGMSVMLTRRTDHLMDHAGQISFPGGRIEETDENAVAAALREAEEEVGLPLSHVEVVGRLDDYATGTGFLVAPVVGVIEPPYPTELDPFEVAEAFEMPLDFVMDPRNHKRESRIFKGVERHFYVLPYEDRYIWGATAAMLVNLYEVLQERGQD